MFQLTVNARVIAYACSAYMYVICFSFFSSHYRLFGVSSQTPGLGLLIITDTRIHHPAGPSYALPGLIPATSRPRLVAPFRPGPGLLPRPRFGPGSLPRPRPGPDTGALAPFRPRRGAPAPFRPGSLTQPRPRLPCRDRIDLHPAGMAHCRPVTQSPSGPGQASGRAVRPGRAGPRAGQGREPGWAAGRLAGSRTLHKERSALNCSSPFDNQDGARCVTFVMQYLWRCGTFVMHYGVVAHS